MFNKTLLTTFTLLSIGMTTATIQADTLDKYQVPLNQYGAVDANAHIPLSVQVPPAPSDLNLPQLVTAQTIWSKQVPPQPTLDVASYIVMDAKSGNIIAEHDANKRIAPASLTKLMLLYVVFEQLKAGTMSLDTQIQVPTVAWATGGSRMFLKPGSKVSVKDLLEGVIVASGNDAAVTLATYVAGTQEAFVDMMNQYAKKLGLTNTHFTTIMGLPAPNLYSSAFDMAKLGRDIILDFPEYYYMFKQKEFSYNGITQTNYNKLLFIDQYADGLKTGSTSEAGFSLVASEKQPNKNRLVAVVIGANNQKGSATAAYTLLKYANRFFTTDYVHMSNDPIGKLAVYKGQVNEVHYGTDGTVAITYPYNVKPSDLKTNVDIKQPLIAPIAKGQTIGQLTITYQDRTLAVSPIVSLESDPEGNIWQKMKGTVSLWFS
ncbi:D-alanyl-D-alanine carboxypeptidase [Thiotrichales bacterium 19S3-7]|nr:D-alanyl-D-alanine carboxypeptidase [Thiotrichales bacterium 19S3-7]MCF6802705.1 D-alanyl-D-alanine carboxypeptidase [Thiotrichales bacterium 19S3-11]